MKKLNDLDQILIKFSKAKMKSHRRNSSLTETKT